MSNPRYTVENHEPSQSIGYLIKRCGALMTQIAERRFESTNVSFTQWTTLMTLCNSPEPISATQLSNYCGHDMARSPGWWMSSSAADWCAASAAAAIGVPWRSASHRPAVARQKAPSVSSSNF